MEGAQGGWSFKGHEALIAELKARHNEPWMTQQAISVYGDMMIIKQVLEKAGKADRVAIAETLRAYDGGPSKYFSGGRDQFDEKGRHVGAKVTIIQWQSGKVVTVYPSELAMAKPMWPNG